MYLIFAPTVAPAFAQGFGITLLPLLRASQSGGGSPEDIERFGYEFEWLRDARPVVSLLETTEAG